MTRGPHNSPLPSHPGILCSPIPSMAAALEPLPNRCRYPPADGARLTRRRAACAPLHLLLLPIGTFLLPPPPNSAMDTAERRLARVAAHLAPSFPATHATSPPLALSPTAASSSSPAGDSYRRVHGDVSSEPPEWRPATDESGKEFIDIIYEKAVNEGIAKITINRPDRRNVFRPLTVKELMRAFNDARDDSSIGVIILTGKGTKAFCSGGDQELRDSDGYVDFDSFGRLNVLDLQVGSFDAGYGSSIMSRLVGPKRAREMWFLSRFYTADEADKMGLVNTVVPLAELERETVKWCRQILRNSPMAIRVLKSALNAADDGHAGLQELGGNATLIFYGTEEAKEGKNAYMERRRPDFSKFPRKP